MTIGPVKSQNFPREYSDSSQNIVRTGCVIEMKCCLFLCIYVLPCCASTLTSLCYIVEMNPFSISDINNQTTYNRKTFIHTNFFSNSTASLWLYRVPHILLPHNSVFGVHCYGKIGEGQCACAGVVCKSRDGLSIQGSLTQWAWHSYNYHLGEHRELGSCSIALGRVRRCRCHLCGSQRQELEE